MEDGLYECDDCKEWFSVWELSYLGPIDREDPRCDLFAPYEAVCHECEEARKEAHNANRSQLVERRAG